MSGTDNVKHERPLTWTCYPFLFFGSTLRQLALALIGLMILYFMYHNVPGSEFGGKSVNVGAVSILGMGFFLNGFFEGWRESKILKGGKITSARLCKVEKNTDSESNEHTLLFRFEENGSDGAAFEVKRDVNDLAIGQYVSVLVNKEMNAGRLEPDLPGGITFAQIYGEEPIPGICWLRILVIPLLTLIPLLSLVGPVSVFIQHAASAQRMSNLFWWTVLVQFIWLFMNRRYFSPGKRFQLNPTCRGCQNVK